MPLLSPDTDAATLHARMRSGQLLVACLCVEWCGTCRSYRKTFTELAERHPERLRAVVGFDRDQATQQPSREDLARLVTSP